MDQDFHTMIADKMRERGLTLKKLAEQSGITLKHLEYLVGSRQEYLPPAPYVRGYIIRLGQILEFDGETWWEKFKEEHAIKTSGAEDTLPKNRFARESRGREIWITIAVLVVLVYFGMRLPTILGRPTLTVINPAEESVVASSDQFVLRGMLAGGDEVLVNGESAPLAADGTWEKTVLLEKGVNAITVTGKKFLGQETILTRQIVYEPPKATSTEP